MADEHTLSTQVAAWTIAVQGQAEHDPAALRELQRAGEEDVLTRIEIHLLTALARCELGDQRGAVTAIEQSLDLAEPDRIILPFVLTGAWRLLESLPAWETAHAALVTSVLDVGRGGTPSTGVLAEELSPSELRVLRHLPTNLTRPEIARRLMVSVNTVNTHIRRIYAKLGATDRGTAVQRGRELRLLSAS
jgi:LuxR family maltose regulon positive regulatory protein